VRPQHFCSLAFQTLHDFFRVLRRDAYFLQRGAEMLEEQIEVRLTQTVLSRVAVCVTNIFPRVHPSAEKHGNEHRLP